jgi:hypothetical protein
MAKLTKERGSKIREEHSGVLEKQICDNHNLQQIGGSRTKVDGTDGISNKSIKNASGSSTQVHLTTQNHFIKSLELDEQSAEFIKLFCGNKEMNNNGKDRFTIGQIDETITESFKRFLNENKLRIIDLIIRNGFNITHVIFNDITNKKEYELTYDEIVERVSDCEWKFMKGGIHLKNSDGKTYFHFQREGKRNPSNRYNVLWHVHKHLFV